MAKANRVLTPSEIIAAEDALMDFQFAVIDALNARGISQTEFAELLGVSRARVSQMLSSEANPTIKLVGRALDVLGLKAEYRNKLRKDPQADWEAIKKSNDSIYSRRPGVAGWHASQRAPGNFKSWVPQSKTVANGNYCDLELGAA
ncbi:helix-turn-helix domain-containing protein [Gellertiella hungarica]|uniref:Transcriptional regulator with XRE-family HTH domain n=1 Tax=Gellertiella hungarica TaxID=1572859 RepID=A0A7W6JB16_9HYPH|nr:helix-turn-helix transcriptional regulator [Gellertiella hungarica]MBB4067158.1 transcriptional regulator with XRE-family HTH domain [Gellertiella hungarica]